MEILTLISLLLIKHFVVDFPLQFPRHYLNKGTYGDIRGLEHSLWHGFATFWILIFFAPFSLAAGLSILEIIAHYHIDWAKMNINKQFNLKPDNSEQFWWLLGADQLLHNVCYIAIVWVVFL